MMEDEPVDDSELASFLPSQRDLDRLKMGASLLKVNAKGKARKRHFRVSGDLKTLTWLPSKKKDTDFVQFDNVAQVVLGRDSEELKKFSGTGKVVEEFFKRAASASSMAEHNISGFLHKKGGSKGGRRNWTKRWHVLSGQQVDYYKKPKDSTPKGSFPISGCIISTVPESKYEYCFSIKFPSDELRLFRAESKADMDEWLVKLRRASRVKLERRRASIMGRAAGMGAGAGAGAGLGSALSAAATPTGAAETFLDWSVTLVGKPGTPTLNITCGSREEAALWIGGLQGLVAYNKASLSASIQIYEEALERNPSDIIARVNVGMALMRQDKIAEALVHLEKAIDLAPSNATAHKVMAQVLEKAGRLPEAVAHTQTACDLAKSNPLMLLQLGDMQVANGERERGVESYKAALHVDPSVKEAHVRLADVLSDLGREKEAKAHYEEALRVDPSFKWAHVNLGLSLERQGDIAGAIEHYDKALHIDDKFVYAYSNLAQAHDRLGNPVEALRCYEKCVELQPKNVRFVSQLAYVKLPHEPEAAVELLAKAAEIRPSVQTHVNHARAIESIVFGDGAGSSYAAPSGGWSPMLDGAEGAYRAAVALEPTSSAARYGLALLLKRKGVDAEAATELAEAQKADPDLTDPAGLVKALESLMLSADTPTGADAATAPSTPRAEAEAVDSPVSTPRATASSVDLKGPPVAALPVFGAALTAEERQAEFFAAMKKEKEEAEAEAKRKKEAMWARMTDEEKEEKRKEEEAKAKHDAKQDRMLRNQLGAYGKRSMTRGRGRGRGRRGR